MKPQANYLCSIHLWLQGRHKKTHSDSLTFVQLYENNIKSFYVTGWSWHDEMWWNNTAGCPLPFHPVIATFYYFPMDIDFLSSLLNWWVQRGGLCFFLLLPCQHYFTEVFTHTTNAVCTYCIRYTCKHTCGYTPIQYLPWRNSWPNLWGQTMNRKDPHKAVK